MCIRDRSIEVTEIKEKSFINTYGSDSLNNLMERLQSTSDSKRRYEYILWLGKSLPLLDEDLHLATTQVKGCISEVYVLGTLMNGKIQWKGFSDALITKGLLAFLIKGLNDLTPFEVLSIDCLLYTSPSPRDRTRSRMPSSA